MEAKNADLSGLRIDRAADAAPASQGLPRGLAAGLAAAGVVVLVAVLLLTTGALGSAIPVHLTPATMVSPIRSGAVLIASGYVVAQRKAAVASGRRTRRRRPRRVALLRPRLDRELHELLRGRLR